MTDKSAATAPKRVSPEQRYHYIGFEVYPGKPGEIFKSDAERTKFISVAEKRRQSGNTLREDCKLIEERVSATERLVMTIAAAVMVISLVLPFYRSHTEQVVQQSASAQNQTNAKGDEIITASQNRKSINRTYYSLSGFESLLAIGGAGGKIFGSGIILILSGVVMLCFTLSCLVVPVMILRDIYGAKGSPDDQALQMKKSLKIAWVPLLLFVGALFLSVIGSSYGFDPANGASYGVPNGLALQSLGENYSIGTFLGTISFGVYVAIAASLLVALKGVEI